MCSLFGWTDYAGIVPHKILRKFTQALANAAEERGTDAAGISYVRNGEVVIYKRPKPAHKIHFNPPEGTTAVMGHTRMATQGDKKLNFNNHPFAGTAGCTSFAFAHNGVLWNDKELRKDKLIPDTHIETDSYAACQLIEQQNKLDFDSLKYMAETVEGNFTFTVLDDSNSLYIIKGSNPMFLLHFKDIGLYVYASTESIMKNALRRIGLYKIANEQINTDEGDIVRIDRNGDITRSEFEPKIFRSKYGSWYDLNDSSYYNIHEEILLAYCGCYGVDSSDVELLLEYGYTCDEIEEMLMDTNLLHEALRDVKYMLGEDVYESYCGAF
ncbi:class II glutamine amidotransferase [Ruminococcus sp. XPD3002]|uniref:class II glutamine amidotransferase n=1 Tax=Ruminococcus sp. XPD3002 TaxID=1452269 RepID=UPI00091B1274|nr:Glutamine amidotransferase domain-containing protein [Ruminococcus flavefaciens]